MTPDPDDPDAPDRLVRPSGLTIAIGVLGVLLAGAAVAIAGFLAGGTNVARTPPDAVGVDTQHGQLGTFPLHDEKPMKAIGKGVVGGPSATPDATSSATPTP
ncbi:hypothetical protein BH10ACT6_BH10ACT6_13010 [soil metagenome]